MFYVKIIQNIFWIFLPLRSGIEIWNVLDLYSYWTFSKSMIARLKQRYASHHFPAAILMKWTLIEILNKLICKIDKKKNFFVECCINRIYLCTRRWPVHLIEPLPRRVAKTSQPANCLALSLGVMQMGQFYWSLMHLKNNCCNLATQRWKQKLDMFIICSQSIDSSVDNVVCFRANFAENFSKASRAIKTLLEISLSLFLWISLINACFSVS